MSQYTFTYRSSTSVSLHVIVHLYVPSIHLRFLPCHSTPLLTVHPPPFFSMSQYTFTYRPSTSVFSMSQYTFTYRPSTTVFFHVTVHLYLPFTHLRFPPCHSTHLLTVHPPPFSSMSLYAFTYRPPISVFLHVTVHLYLPSIHLRFPPCHSTPPLRGLVKLKRIKKYEINWDWPDLVHPPSYPFFLYFCLKHEL